MNWQDFMSGSVPSSFSGDMGVLFAVFMLWSLVWKGMSLWKASQNKSKPWFVVLLVINTLGILDILYIYIFSKKSNKMVEEPKSEMTQQ